MSSECYPISVLPHISRIYADYLSLGEAGGGPPIAGWYRAPAFAGTWADIAGETVTPESVTRRERLAEILRAQSLCLGAGPQVMENIDRLGRGARAVVTGQQVGLFGGPLLTLLKAATAVARAREATRRTGLEHVPVFWMATEDHDLAEVDQVSLPGRSALETLSLDLSSGLRSNGREVGGVVLGEGVGARLDQVDELLGYAPVCELLRACYTPDATLGEAFGRWMTRLFAAEGLIVMDAAGRDFHALGRSTLQAGIERAEEFEAALLARSAELEREGYHAQVLVKPGSSLLFLLETETGERQALRRTGDRGWKAGARAYATADLLAILDEAPERLSPNALLRPVFQDTILPTAAYIGGPAEIAYFAQSAVLYGRVLGRLTPVLPRFSATLIEPGVAAIIAKDEVTLKDVIEAGTVEILTQRLGARAMPIEGKRRLAAAGNAMDAELGALTGYLESMDASLGRSAAVSASKMRYQMNRLRRMAATFETQKDASLRKHATAMMLQLFPSGRPQERVIGGAWFLARAGEELIARLVHEAEEMCLGHTVVRI